MAFESSRRHDVLSRAEAFTSQLQAELAEARRLHKIAAGIIREFGQLPIYSGPPRANGSL